jgi:hypothetical protein
MIRSDDEVPPPKVGPPMSDRLYKPDQLPFIGGELEIARREWSAEEGAGTCALVEDCPEPRSGSIAVDREWPVKVQKMEYRGSGESPLEAIEHYCHLPLLEQLGGGGDGAVVLDEMTVVPRET